MFSCSHHLIEWGISLGGQSKFDEKECGVISWSPAPVYTRTTVYRYTLRRRITGIL